MALGFSKRRRRDSQFHTHDGAAAGEPEAFKARCDAHPGEWFRAPEGLASYVISQGLAGPFINGSWFLDPASYELYRDGHPGSGMLYARRRPRPETLPV
jgi:hypothetical protein